MLMVLIVINIYKPIYHWKGTALYIHRLIHSAYNAGHSFQGREQTFVLVKYVHMGVSENVVCP